MNDHRHVSPNEYLDWSCDQVREELGAWALGALESAEMAAIERHVSVCDACSADASSFTSVASMLPFSLAPISTTAETRRSLMSRIADDQSAAALPASTVRSLRPASPVPGATDGGRTYHWSQMLVAPLAIALLVMTLWAFELREQVDEQGSGEGTTSNTSAMLPEGIQTFSMQSDCEQCQAAGKLLADPRTADALMVAWNLDPSQVHEVWCEERDGEKVLVASLDVSESGEVVQPLVFDQPIAGYSQIYVASPNGDRVEINIGMSDTDLVSPTEEKPELQ